ncbi:neuropathy target esterase sws isoform X1 [Anopheles cruzii]|uniref:neuropathy target esterase sws isoform X1 n=1 Tax=Anopheles cruzii TaxID=68878 RepID=UPI0022EC2589|nr:neuropathy target esterase sws isoform X1 [Anopheles cruzii]
MDIVGLVKKSYADYGTMLKDSWYTVITEEMHYTWTWTYWILACTFIISVYCMRYVRLKRIREKEENEQFTSPNLSKRSYAVSQQRFRKRDKMMFYGRRMLRKVKTISGQAYSGQGKKRRAVVRFARNLLLRKDATPPQRHVIEPPAEYLEEASDGSGRVPPDALYLLQSIRIFGHFDTPVFLKLCKHTEILDLSAGESLIKVGDADDSVYIVQTGQVNVFLNNLDGTSITLKVVRQGESVTSLLSFIDVLVGNTSQYKTVTARAMEASLVIRLPMFAFKEVFSECPGLLVRVVQAIMVRLQRVTITALHNYLGLSTEYIQVQCSSQRKKTTAQMKSCSPGHRRIPSDQVQTHSLVGDLKLDTLIDGSDGALLVSARNSNFPIRSLVVDDAKSDIPFDSSDILHNNNASTSIVSSDSDEFAVLKASAVEGFVQELGLNDTERSIVEKFIVIKEVKSTNIIIRQGILEDVLLIFVISGGLTLAQCPQTGLRTEEESKKPLEKGENHSINIHPGDMIGGLAVLTGESSLYTIRAKHFSRVGLLTKDVIYEIISHRPSMVLDIANSVVKQLSPLVRQCDFALDWNFIESGRAVYRQGESSDCTYIVLNGRLRSVVTHPNSKKEIVGEYGKGDLIGIIEMIAETPRTTTVMAVRDSELAKLPEGLFNAIKIKYPIVVTQLISLLSHRILGSMQSFGSLASSRFPSVPLDTNQPVQHRYSTVAILATSDEVPLLAFTYELYHSLSAIGSTVRLTSDIIRDTLGVNVMEHSSEYRLTSWLGQQEDRHNITLYQCDNDIGQWTQRCLRQADVILIVALGSQSPTIGRLEKEIDRLAIRTAKELVLLHSQSSDSCPTNTIGWLNMRSWVSRHHHIQCPNSIFNRRTPGRIHETYDKRMNSKPYIHSDFSRLARWLTGNSVGLVLGGGGARGAAHVGMLKAIQEAGIPIDMVGGVSIGAFMGALWCMEKNITPMTQKAREWCKKMTQWGRQLRDLTYPITSMFSGRHFNQTIRGTFGDVCIEDLWIPFFTLTTDISASCARVHTHGSTWRYVRSSMSLSGYMPPLCDPKDGHLLLDGGYVNNLPADVMRSQGAAHIIAIDVGSQDDTDLTDYGDDLSGWWLLYKRWNPFTSPVKVPNLPDIQSRLAYVSCVRQLEEVKKSDYCEYIRPPIDKYKTLAFGSFDEIKTVGFEHGKICFEEMDKNGRLSRFNAWSVQSMPKKETHSLNEYTFVDLAQLVCKVPETYPERIYSSSEEDYYDGYASEPSSKPSLKRSLQALRPAGGSLSLSENEMDSDDLEIPMPFNTLQANLVVRGDRK